VLFLKKLSVSDGKSVYTMLQGIERNDNGFHNDVKGMPYDEFADWLCTNEAHSNSIGLPDWMVPQTQYWLYDNDTPVGCGRIRHYLNDSLIKDGGHIGYAISYPYRGKGYGNEILRLLLIEARGMDIREVHIGANKDNAKSNKIILNNNGRLHRETEVKNYYIINL